MTEGIKMETIKDEEKKIFWKENKVETDFFIHRGKGYIAEDVDQLVGSLWLFEDEIFQLVKVSAFVSQGILYSLNNIRTGNRYGDARDAERTASLLCFTRFIRLPSGTKVTITAG